MEKDEAFAQLENESSSKLSDRDISDRKTAALVKDLKKQLKSEQKKSAKMNLEMSKQLSASQGIILDAVLSFATAGTF